MSAPRETAWHALTCAPAREQGAADWLTRAQVPVYWPFYTRQVAVPRRPGHRRPLACAVIPGYLFAAGGEPYSLVRTTPNVFGCLRAALTEADIAVIRRIEEGLNRPRPPAAHPFRIGSKVRFTDDLLGKWPPGIVVAVAHDTRIGVQTRLLGRIVAIWAHPHQIVAL